MGRYDEVRQYVHNVYKTTFFWTVILYVAAVLLVSIKVLVVSIIFCGITCGYRAQRQVYDDLEREGDK